MWQSLFQGDNKGAVNSSGNLAKGSRRSGADQVNTKDEQGKNLLVNVSKIFQCCQGFHSKYYECKAVFSALAKRFSKLMWFRKKLSSRPLVVCPLFFKSCEATEFCRDGAQAKGPSRPASKFIDGAPRLAVRERAVDKLDSFLPLLLFLLFKPKK